MNGPALVYTVRWLIWDTFRQAIASRIFWIMLAVSGLAVVFCLGIHIESSIEKKQDDMEIYGPDNQPYTGPDSSGRGSISLLYGLMPNLAWNRPVREAVLFIQLILASWVAGAIGMVLTLIWTAGFVPDFLQPNSASVLLAKPVPRWTLIVGKYIGVLAFVTFQILVFFAGTWFALGLRTNVWEYGYLASIPLFVLQFAIIFSFTILIAVCTRSTVACIFGSILFWLICWGMNIGRHFVVGIEAVAPEVTLGQTTQFLTEVGYWILPKPADLLILNEQALGIGNLPSTLAGQEYFQRVQQDERFMPELSVTASLVFTVVLLAISARQLADTDY
jgi:ABC-type transport system involved in multi-copper enzyme maturation permease subunit